MAQDDAPPSWPPPGCPPLAWPAPGDDRQAWYRAAIGAFETLWGGRRGRLQPATEAAVAAAEARLGCRLPPALRAYHLTFGTLDLSERLCSLDARAPVPLQPLRAAYPSIDEVPASDEERALVPELVAFGDALGSGNMFCFHRATGEAWFFDHDQAPAIVRFAGDVGDYLDALVLRTLAEVHERPDDGEPLLEQRFGAALVRKWLY